VNLRQKIEQEIRERGPMPFSRYMEMCLYDPELGYYSRPAEKFGKAGDFYTSSDVHAVFGRLLARQFEEMWRVLDKPEQLEILELGPGRGLFAQDVLDWSEKKFPEFYRSLRYTLVERSPSLRERLRALFGSRLESGKVQFNDEVDSDASAVARAASESGSAHDLRVQPVPADSGVSRAYVEPNREPQRLKPSSQLEPTARLEAESFQRVEPEGHDQIVDPEANRRTVSDREGQGFSRAASSEKIRASAPEVPLIVFANEFFDALPVEVLSEKGSLRINARNGNFVEEWAPASGTELEFLDHYSVHPEGDARTEAALLAQRQMARHAETIQAGFLVIIDYGYTREEQLAGRHLGTVMAYREHSASPNPYEAPGEQDITARVNFTALAAAAEQSGMHAHKLLTQSQFLLGIGETNQFADAFDDCRLPQERAKVALQLKHLVTPAGMGETFHVLVGSKGMSREAVRNLSGLSFGRS
jgi:SAM-dependent MidA family methyltransferase